MLRGLMVHQWHCEANNLIQLPAPELRGTVPAGGFDSVGGFAPPEFDDTRRQPGLASLGRGQDEKLPGFRLCQLP